MNLRDTDHQHPNPDMPNRKSNDFIAPMTEAQNQANSEAQTQKALIHSQKLQALGSLAGGIVHDFNNVFAAVLLQLDLACEQPDLTPSIREDLESAKSCAARGAELVKRLLTFSRPAPAVIRELHPCDIINDLVALLERTITRRINISGAAPQESWAINGDENQLHLVFISLSLYSRDAMPNGGKIRLEASNASFTAQNSPSGLPGEFVHFVLSDTSAGQLPSVVDRLFEPNFITKESAQGSGLSLGVAQSIVVHHGGWITAESQQSQGNRFHIYLPRSTPQETQFELERSPAKAKTSQEGTENVLIIDNDEMMRNLLRAVLSYRGYKIVEATGETEGLERAFDKIAPAELVVLSADLPNSAGWDILTKLHSIKPELPIIVCGSVDSGLKTKALATGAKNVLIKPFSNPELVQMVRDTLDGTARS